MNRRLINPRNVVKERRRFGARAVALLGQTKLTKSALDAEVRQPLLKGQLKAAVIGHTGHGDYGDEMDRVFEDREDVELSAVADPHGKGLKAARERLQPLQIHADFQELLVKEQPQLVSIATRSSAGHFDMIQAALESGAHCLIEHPFTSDLEEADELVGLAKQQQLRLAVAQRMRMAPNIIHLSEVLRGGLIGELLEIRAWGRQDETAGGEDLMHAGGHQFDLMRMFAGSPLWCSARILQDGKEAMAGQARIPNDNVGPVLGDEVMAQFAFPNGVHGTWTSRRRLREQVGNWAVEFHGSEGAARINCNSPPMTYVARRAGWSAEGRVEQWEPLVNDPIGNENTARLNVRTENRRVVDDWIEASRAGREPACSTDNAIRSLEMVMGVYRSALSGQRISFPLKNRTHPLISG